MKQWGNSIFICEIAVRIGCIYACSLPEMSRRRSRQSLATIWWSGGALWLLKVCTENYQFYQYMEKYEIYGGRKNPLEFKSIVMQRIHDFRSCGNLFECSFFQNIMEELMLFAMYSEQQIEEFYKEIISMLDMPKFKLVRIIPRDIENCIKNIRAERVNEQGEEVWYPLMMSYLSSSNYGKKHGVSNFDDIITHFKRRMELENRVIRLMPEGCCIHVESKNYEITDILSALTEGL